MVFGGLLVGPSLNMRAGKSNFLLGSLCCLCKSAAKIYFLCKNGGEASSPCFESEIGRSGFRGKLI